MFFAVICMLFSMGIFSPERVDAAAYNDAYAFYQKYGMEMAFEPTQNMDGDIYCVTKGKSSTSNVKYKNLGWKVSVVDSFGKTLDVIYYALGGNYMVEVDSCTVDGYVYILYKVPFSNLKQRMTQNAREALKTANCNILFDACMTRKIDDKLQGSMNDDGPIEGEIYTTYDGIVGADDWTDESNETLHTYFNKEVVGLFYSITVDADAGIAQVSGAGRYCYGTTVTLSAEAADGYVFGMWNGPVVSLEKTITYVVEMNNVIFTAHSQLANVDIHFFSGMETNGKPTKTVSYTITATGQKLCDFQWKKEGYHQIGWSESPDAQEAEYEVTEVIYQFWLEEKYPEVNLYAVWEPNIYTITFHGNGGKGDIEPVECAFTDEITLPAEGFIRTEKNLEGWGITTDAKEYARNETIKVEELVRKCKLETYHQAEIILYVIWGSYPQLHGDVIYVSLEDAKNGKVTEEWLHRYVYATDEEDGDISYGQNETNAFYILDYSISDFTEFKKGGCVTETFYVMDSSGNERKKIIPVYIVDTTVYDASIYFGKSRFISSKYYKDTAGKFIDKEQGGLSTDSIWRCDSSYSEILDKIFKKM